MSPCTTWNLTCVSKSIYSVEVFAFPHMLFWVILMSSHCSAGQNQSEEKGFVTPSFSLSRCNMTLEKIDQEMYFWTLIASPLTFKVVVLLSFMTCEISFFKRFLLSHLLTDFIFLWVFYLNRWKKKRSDEAFALFRPFCTKSPWGGPRRKCDFSHSRRASL